MVNILHRSTGHVTAMDLGYKPISKFNSEKKKNAKLVYLLGSDEHSFKRSDFNEDVFIVYQGHHGDKGAEIADVILPGAAYTEKEGTYVNTEGRPQKGYNAIGSPGESRVDWKIIRALSEIAGRTLPYDTLNELRQRLIEVSPHFAHPGSIEHAGFFKQALQLAENGKVSKSLDVKQKDLAQFWMTNSISRASPTMADCVRASRRHQQDPHADGIRERA